MFCVANCGSVWPWSRGMWNLEECRVQTRFSAGKENGFLLILKVTRKVFGQIHLLKIERTGVVVV